MKRRKSHQAKLSLSKCEVCLSTERRVINVHHIIPRCDERCTNDNSNLAVLCANCHNLVHAGEIIIIGVYDTSFGRDLMFFKKGEKPPLEEQFWKIKNNDKVITK